MTTFFKKKNGVYKSGDPEKAGKAKIPQTQKGSVKEPLSGNTVDVKSNKYNPKSTKQLQRENAIRQSRAKKPQPSE